MIGVIGGTGLNAFIDGQPCGIKNTPYGDTSAEILKAEISGKPVFFLARHGSPHSIPPHKINYRANLWAMKQAGVSNVFAVNAVGGISLQMEAGVIVLPNQLIDYTYGREHTYADGVSGSLNHCDFSFPFNDVLRSIMVLSAKESSIDILSNAVYGVTQGPRLETAAEINRMARDGCDIVGMTAMPEAALARELEMNYASICLVVNPAAGKGDTLITMEAIQQVVDNGMEKVRAVLFSAISRL